jgi:hypothetical protein
LMTTAKRITAETSTRVTTVFVFVDAIISRPLKRSANESVVCRMMRL